MRKFLNFMLLGCAAVAGPSHAGADDAVSSTASAAPVARSNWAVARLDGQVYAFYGLGPAKTSRNIARDVHAFDLASGQWRRIGELPVGQGRLASAAVTVAGAIYVIGGYTVSAAGAEVSTPDVLRFSPAGGFAAETRMPVPVDDTVAMPWRDRWIVLVSGWHDTANVRDVQFYDTQTRLWAAGTPWPGKPVFGHAGALVDDAMVVCDGVASARGPDGKNAFAITNECWQGDLDAAQIGKISWRRLPAHPGPPLYRAGAAASSADGQARIVFAGGSPRPYNYDGIGYDHVPAEPSAAVFSFQPRQGSWQVHAPLPEAGMDFRALVDLDGAYGLFGGMRAGQRVSGGVIRFVLKPAK